jgi:hypothetical protein
MAAASTVPIVWIGKRQAVDQIFIAGDECIGGVGIHQCAGTFQLCARQIWALTQQRADPFLMNSIRPPGTK